MNDHFKYLAKNCFFTLDLLVILCAEKTNRKACMHYDYE